MPQSKYWPQSKLWGGGELYLLIMAAAELRGQSQGGSPIITIDEEPQSVQDHN